MESFAAVIDALGGTTKTAARVGLPVGTVCAMKSRNSIAAAYWGRFVRAAEEHGTQGITLEELSRLADEKVRSGRKRRKAAA